VNPPDADCVWAGYLNRTFRVSEEVAEEGEPLAYSVTKMEVTIDCDKGARQVHGIDWGSLPIMQTGKDTLFLPEWRVKVGVVAFNFSPP
jgi:hypothetical protein